MNMHCAHVFILFKKMFPRIGTTFFIIYFKNLKVFEEIIKGLCALSLSKNFAIKLFAWKFLLPLYFEKSRNFLVFEFVTNCWKKKKNESDVHTVHCALCIHVKNAFFVSEEHCVRLNKKTFSA